MKITVLLRKDHEALRSILRKYEKSGSQPGRDKTIDELVQQISAHLQMENDIFYPAVKNTPSPRAVELIELAMADHAAIDHVMDELRSATGHDKRYNEKMAELVRSLNLHLDRGEEIFEEAWKNLPESRLEELGLEMEDRRRLMAQLAA